MNTKRMQVLFVSGGNQPDGRLLHVVRRQAKSLADFVEIDHYIIKGRGFKGYLKNVLPLRKKINAAGYDVVHAHYLFSGIVAGLASSKPVVTSLMGSDVNKNRFWRLAIRLFSGRFWRRLIVKSRDMHKKVHIENARVIPNGVDFHVFRPMDKSECQRQIGFASNVKHVLFLSNPNRPEKNVDLAKSAVKQLGRQDVVLDIVHGIASDKVPVYLNASDVVILTSLWEGSPNVIKEAMACSRPIVSTDVGDVKDVVADTDGCYIAANSSAELAVALQKVLMFEGSTTGRAKVAALSDVIIARQITELYRELVHVRPDDVCECNR